MIDNVNPIFPNENNSESDHSKNFYQMTIPPPSEWDKAPDIKVTDTRTGKITILEMQGYFELCEGLCLRIKAKEKAQWEKETADAKKLSLDQQEILKAALVKIGSTKELTRKEIVTIIEEIRKPQKRQTFRQSRELIDNKLDREIENAQTCNDRSDGKEREIGSIEMPIIKGLDLEQSEDRIVHTLTLLLSKKSERKDQASEDYYMGNYEKGIVSINQLEMETARIIVSPHEFYSAYFGRDNYGADNVKSVLQALNRLSKKLYLTAWKFPKASKGYTLFRTYCPLFQMALINEDLSEFELNELITNESLLEGKRCKFLFKFQPQFTNNIRERYVEFPEDIYLRISHATNKDRVPQCVNLMRDFLFREKQNKRYNFLRDKITIIKTLKLDKFWKEGRKKKVNEMIHECVEIFIKIGLLNEWEEVEGANGQAQFRIQINKEFK